MPRNDPTETARPRIRLSRLRDIGWTLWNPIGLLGRGQKWDDEECLSFADEYDSYLLQAASQLRQGTPAEEVAHYLADIEYKHMALNTREGALKRARPVVAAIQADKDLWTPSED